MGLDHILSFTIIVDMQSGETDISYPLESGMNDFKMIKLLREIINDCFFELQDELREREGK